MQGKIVYTAKHAFKILIEFEAVKYAPKFAKFQQFVDIFINRRKYFLYGQRTSILLFTMFDPCSASSIFFIEYLF